METTTLDVFQFLLQVGGTPALVLGGLYYLWHHGVRSEIAKVTQNITKDVDRITATVENIRTDLQIHRDAVLKQQASHTERIQRLEILAEEVLVRRSNR
jgi:hypothetical protein